MRKGSLSRGGVLAIMAACGLAAPAIAEFRVFPYLMNPQPDGMTINWFSPNDVNGTITITGPGLAAPLVLATNAELKTVLDYVFNTENSPVFNPADGRVYFNGAPARNWKHSVTLTGLQPASTYAYTVSQGAATFNGSFRTAPTTGSPAQVRIHALADSETLIIGRTTRREWSVGAQAPGSTGRPTTGPFVANYLVTETIGYQQNIKAMKTRNPDLIVMPGDLIQGTNTEQQRRWDEFWRHNAGEYDTILSAVPIVAAIGNNCIFLAGANTIGLTTGNQFYQFARKQWSAYFDFPSNGNPNYQDLYFRTDYGPVTILTLCVVKAIDEGNHLFSPDRTAAGAPQPPNVFDLTRFPPRDTNRAWFDQLYTFGDYPDFNPWRDAAQTVPGEQWTWAVQQLQDARAQGQIIFVQWHHTPYSRGVHGSFVTSTQSGEATRIYTPILEQYRVAAVLAGHSEMLERSFLDDDNDGYGINYFDVGAAGDGLRGVEDAPGAVNPRIIAFRQNYDPNFVMNPYSVWTADQSFPEVWQGPTLLAGGKHYGFMEIDVTPLPDSRFRVSMRPFHVFPLNNGGVVTGFELRPYNDRVVLEGPANDLREVPFTVCAADCNEDGSLTPADFVCFLQRLRVGDVYAANCDNSTTSPLLTPADFVCFLNRYTAGCP